MAADAQVGPARCTASATSDNPDGARRVTAGVLAHGLIEGKVGWAQPASGRSFEPTARRAFCRGRVFEVPVSSLFTAANPPPTRDPHATCEPS